MRTARVWGLPPTVMAGYRKQDGTYTTRDMVVAIAVQRFEDTICPGCGLPASVTQGDHNVGRIEVHDQGICHGCEAVESYKSDPNRQTFPGQKLHLKVDWD